MSETTRFPVVDGGVRYTVAPDDSMPDGVRTQSLVRARLIDELTLAPLSDSISVLPFGGAFTTPRTRALVNPRSAAGGLVGLVGVPVQALPALATTPYEVGVAIRAGGYIPTNTVGTLASNPAFPVKFAPLDLGDIALHRSPLSLFGRTMLRKPLSTDPLAGAVITVSGFWRTVPTPFVAPAASLPNLVAIDPPLYSNRPAATTLTEVALTPDVAHAKSLMRDAVAGATQLYISDRVALVAGDIVGIDETDVDRAEWVTVLSIAGSTSATEPAVATLDFPLARAHRTGALAHPVAAVPAVATTTLSLDAVAGDVTLLVAAAAAFTASAVRITVGVMPALYHRLSPYVATSDANGDYRLPPLSRVAQVTLAATHPMHPALPTRTVTLEFPRQEQRVDHVFS